MSQIGQQIEAVVEVLKETGSLCQKKLVQKVCEKYQVPRDPVVMSIIIGQKKGIFKYASSVRGNSLIELQADNHLPMGEKITHMDRITETLAVLYPPVRISELADHIARIYKVKRGSIEAEISRQIKMGNLKLIVHDGENVVVLKNHVSEPVLEIAESVKKTVSQTSNGATEVDKLLAKMREKLVQELAPLFCLKKKYDELKAEHVEALDELETLRQKVEATTMITQELLEKLGKQDSILLADFAKHFKVTPQHIQNVLSGTNN